MNDERLLTTMEAAQFLGLDTGTLKRWRTRGVTPPLPYVKVSANRARYSPAALKAFVAERTRQNTAQDTRGRAA
jgi:predicted site-specific integrase-resolvase